MPATGETGIGCDDPFFQTCRHCYGLENGTWFISITDAEVFPHGIEVIHLFLAAELIPVFCISDIFFPCRNRIGIIQIKRMGFRHGVYLAGIGVHDHSRHVFRGPFRRCFRYHFFGDLLNIIVDGGDDSIPVFCVIILMHNGVRTVIKNERASGCSFHIAVVITFQSPLGIPTSKTNEMTGGTVEGIRTLTALFKINTFQIQGFQFFLHTAVNAFHQILPVIVHVKFPCFRIDCHILFQYVIIQFWKIFTKGC